ncbi:MAG: arginine repressor [Lachnospiraceae bacterium]|nr:arginine repressor [Lachnospiraceae bacterium]
MPGKANRLQKILEIIDRDPIETQEELCRALRESGYDVTQATVSRDVRELRLSKRLRSDGRLCYSSYSEEDVRTRNKFIRVIRDAVVSMDNAGNLLVIHTISGMAMAAAAAIDTPKFEDVVGCLAGDDTIFVAMKEPQETVLLIERIRHLIAEEPRKQ